MTELPHDHGTHLNINQIRDVIERKEFESMSKLATQLGDITRMLRRQPFSHMGMSSPAVSHHLRLIRDSGLITSTRVDKEVYYTVADMVKSRFGFDQFPVPTACSTHQYEEMDEYDGYHRNPFGYIRVLVTLFGGHNRNVGTFH